MLLSGLGTVNNRGGEISSTEGFTLAATGLDNTAGRIISEQELGLAIAGDLGNQGGSLAGRAVELVAHNLDNSADGLVHSHGELAVRIDSTLTNRSGSLIADGPLDLQAGHVDNSGGQIASRGDIQAVFGDFTQEDGELVAEGALSLSGDALDNRDSLVAAGGDLNVDVGKVDNRGGEISSRDGARFLASSLDNSDGGRLLAAHLNLTIERLLNRNQGLIYGWDEARLNGAMLDNSGGTLASDKLLSVELEARPGDDELDGHIDNSGGSLSSEGTLNLAATRIDNQQGALSSAGALQLTTTGELLNLNGQVMTDSSLLLHSAGLVNTQGQISAASGLDIVTGAFDNTRGRVTGGTELTLDAKQVINTQGRIASSGPLVANLHGLDQQGGELFSQDSLSLDLNGGNLINDGALLHAPGQLLLRNLGAVSNRGGEISSSQGFLLAAESLDNDQGRLLSEQDLVVRIAQSISNVVGLISAQGVELTADALDNQGGTLIAQTELSIDLDSTLSNVDKGLIQAGAGLLLDSGEWDNHGGYLLAGSDLVITLDGALNNRDGGLVNSQGRLELSAASLDSSDGGEVSAKGEMQLALDTLVQRQGALLGESALSLDLHGGTLDNQGGLISSNGPLTMANLGHVDNRGADITSLGLLELTAASLDNRGGNIISRDWLRLALGITNNQGGLLSGWEGLRLVGTRLDNSQVGTLSSRNGDLWLELTEALLNNDDGAVVAGGQLDLLADSVDNRKGILSSAGEQHLNVAAMLDNSGGQIDASAMLKVEAERLKNQGGLILGEQALEIHGAALENAGGQISAGTTAYFDLSGDLDNSAGQVASGGKLDIHAADLGNQGGTLASQGTGALVVDSLDNSARGTLAANGRLDIEVNGAVDNSDDGLIYSRDASLHVAADSLDNRAGAMQGQSDLVLNIDKALNNAGGTLQSRSGDITLDATTLDNRQGILASLEGWVRSRLSGWLNNGSSGLGGLIQGKHLDLAANGTMFNVDGRIQALEGGSKLSASAFDNQRGTLYAQGELLLSGGTLDNRAGTLGAGNIDIDLTGALNNAQGIVESGGTLSIDALSLNNQSGQLRALGRSGTSFFRLGGLLDNRNGVLESANRNLTLSIGSLANQGGRLLHAGDGELGLALAQAAGAGGQIATHGGLTLKANSWSNSSVLQAGRLTLDVGTFSQTSSGQLLATESFVGKGGNWTNHGLIASDGTLSLALTGRYSGNGRLTSLGDLSLNAASLDLSTSASIAGGDLARVTSSGLLTNRGTLTSGSDLTVRAATLNNYGTLGSAEQLWLYAPTLLNEKGLIFSGDDMHLYTQSLRNFYGDIYSMGGLDLARDAQRARATRLENRSATIESLKDMRIDVNALVNTKDTFETQQRMVSGYIHGQCTDCSGNHEAANYYVANEYISEVIDDSPSSFIASGGNLQVKSASFENIGSAVSSAGNLSIQADRFVNQGASEGLSTHLRIFDSGLVKDDILHDVGGPISNYNSVNHRKSKEFIYVLVGGQLLKAYRGSEEDDIDFGYAFFNSYIHPVTGAIIWKNPDEYKYHEESTVPLAALPWQFSSIFKLKSETWQYEPTGTSTNAVIQAGGTVSIQASQSLNNSVIAPGVKYQGGGAQLIDTAVGSNQATVIVLNSQLPPDLAQQQLNPLTLPGFALPTGQNGLFRLSGQAGSDAQVRDAASSPQWTITGGTLEQAQRQPGVSAAMSEVYIGDAIDLRATEAALQAAAREQADGLPALPGDIRFGGDAVTGIDKLETSGLSTSQANLVRVAHDGQQFGDAFLRAQGVLVTPVSQPHKYLIETNPALTNLKQFMGSDYLLGHLGYDTDATQKRLGDGLYEQRLIREAIIARTGQRYLNGLTSDEAMFRYLMDNAIASKDRLGLSLGVTLTAEQVAALTHDIVWMEEHQVMGQKVLVPVLYLAQAEGRLAANGALIQGRDVTLISGGDLANQGTLRASGNLDVRAVEIANSGLMDAGERLQLLAEGSIRNAQGGIIAGRDVSLIAGEDILNERSVGVHHSGVGHQQWVISFADSAARIEALGDLSLVAGRDVANLGGVLDSRGDLSISAGRDVSIASVQDVQHHSRGDYFLDERVTQLGADVRAGRDLEISAGRDLAIIGSEVQAGRDLGMQAGQDITLASAANESHFYSRTKKVIREQEHVQQQATQITAGGSLDIIAGEDLNLVSSRLDAGDEAYLVAGDELNLLAAQDYDYSLYQKKKKGSFGRKSFQRDEETRVTHVGSEITTGGDLTLASGGDQTYQVARLESGEDLSLSSGGAITFEGVKDLEQESHEKSKSSWAWQSAKGKGNTDETLRQSALIARGETVIHAVEGLQIDVTHIDQKTVSQSIDAMVKADPELAWIKEMESRGDVDWQRVKEVHDSFKYSSSGVSGPVAIVVAIIVAYLTAGAASGLIGSAATATAGSGTAMAAAGTATASAVAAGATVGSTVAAGWANATLAGILAGAAGGAAGAASQGQDWQDAALTGAITGGFAGYLSAGTYFNNPVNTAGKIGNHIGSGEWLSLGKEVSRLGMNHAFGKAQAKVAEGMGLKPEELNWILMAASIAGNQWDSVGSRFVKDEEHFKQTDSTGIKGVANRENIAAGAAFDLMDIALGYQGLPDASVQDFLRNQGLDSASSSGHSLGTLSNIYLGSNGLTGEVHLYSVPFGAVAPPNAEVMIGTWDIVNGGWAGKMFNWDADVVPIKPWEHGLENYEKYIK